jgi:hypothetical protein
MSRRTLLIRLSVMLVALVVVGVITTPGVRADPERTKLKPPTLLWKKYPLQPRPAASAQTAQRRSRSSRQASPPASTDTKQFPSLLFVTLALAGLVALGATVLLGLGLVPIDVGGLRRKRVPPSRAPSRGVGEELFGTLQRKLRRSEPTPQTVAASDEADEPEPEPALDVQLQELIERVKKAPRAERKQLAQKIEALHELIGARAPPEAKATAPTDKRTPPARLRAHRQRTGVARCEIKLWRGFVHCRLYAAPAGSEEALALSPSFRLRREAEPNLQAEDALEALLAKLELDGWTVVSEGPKWYQHHLERPKYAEPR